MVTSFFSQETFSESSPNIKFNLLFDSERSKPTHGILDLVKIDKTQLPIHPPAPVTIIGVLKSCSLMINLLVKKSLKYLMKFKGAKTKKEISEIIDNNSLISINDRDTLIKFRQFY